MVVNNGADQSADGVGGIAGRVLAGRYRIVTVVSAGANTVIADAFDIDANQPVTFKIVRPTLAASEEFRHNFRRRAEVATALIHPNIATVLDWGDVEINGESTVFWVVEYLAGGSLRDLLDRGRLLEPSQALLIGLEACRALDAAHQRGLAHTELAPSKLVFGEDRRLRIIDFGMAELLGRKAWSEPATVATHVARYASPEQALGIDVGTKTDVYSLALSLLEAMTGAVPFSSDSTVSTLAARVGKLLPVSADLGAMASVLERAGRPEPEDRSTASEFGRALVQAAERLPRPEPIPIVAAELFDTSAMRRPDDPTGGIARPADDAHPGADQGADQDEDANHHEAQDSNQGDTATSAPVAVDSAAGSETDADPESTTPAPTDPDALETGSLATASGDPAVGTTENAADTAHIADIAGTADSTDALGPAPTLPAGAVADSGGPAPATGDTAAPADVAEAPETAGPTESSGSAEPAVASPSESAGDMTATDPVAPAASGAQGASSDALIILTDIADPPTGSVQVAADDRETDQPETTGSFDQAAAVAAAPHAATPRTEQMPATAAPATAAAPVHHEVYDDERPGRRAGVIVALSLFVIAGLVAVAFAGFFLLRTKSHDVPNLVGVQEAVALNEIAGNDWVVVPDFERNDEFPIENTVISTFPAAGVQLDEGEEFRMLLSLGPEFRELPEIADLTSETAQAELETLQLSSFVEVEEFDEDLAAGTVISWRVLGDASKVAGDPVLPGTSVALTVSIGPAPRVVPSVIGLTLEEAQARAATVQLNVVPGVDEFSDDIPVGIILSQDVAEGTELERGATFSVGRSKGLDLIELPVLDGLSYTDAQTALTDAGFTIGSLLGTTEGTFESISIEADTIDGLYRRGTSVDLIFL